MIRTATHADLAAIQALLTRACDGPYDVVRVAEEKCFGDGVSGPPVVRVFDDAGIAVRCGKYLRLLAVDRERRGRGIGTALLEDAGARMIGAEPGNYFTPGVLDPRFFERRGYVRTAETNDLEAELGDAIASDPRVTPATPPLLDFIECEFGRAWRFESERAAILLQIEADGEIAGFAAAEANNRGLGTFGPTGVARRFRGRGFGTLLARAALAELRRLGYRTAIIPWTDALEFYRKACGARLAHTYITLARSGTS